MGADVWRCDVCDEPRPSLMARMVEDEAKYVCMVCAKMLGFIER